MWNELDLSHMFMAAKLATQKPGSAHTRSKAPSMQPADRPAHSTIGARARSSSAAATKSSVGEGAGEEGVPDEESEGKDMSEDQMKRAPRGSLRPQAGDGSQSAFDFSTMADEELGLIRSGPIEGESGDDGEGLHAEQASPRPRDITAHDRVFDKKTGKAAVRTGLPKDTYKTAVQYDGSLFNPFSAESSDGLRAKVLYGFRSKALSLQVRLAERLRSAAHL